MSEILHNVPALNSVFLVIMVALFIYRSRTWSVPVQSHLITLIEDELRTLRGNVLRLERDQLLAHRQYMDSNEMILKEVRAITANGALHPITDELKVIEDRLLDMEQVVASMPCAPKCAKPEEKTDEK
jgi:hypothetical protein